MIRSIICFALLLTLTGCASIAGNNTRKVSVTSYPAGATIMVDNQPYGATPNTITLPSYIYGGKSISVQKKGYQSQYRMVNTQFQPIGLLNIIFWPGFIVDAVAGNTVKIDPADLNLEFHMEKA